MIQLPSAVGLKVCQEAILDVFTGHVSLINCYRKLSFNSFPTPPQSFTVCAVLTDGMGEIGLSVEISPAGAWQEEDRLILRSLTEKFLDPLKEKWFLIRVSQFSYPEPGRYVVTLWATGEEIAHTTLEILEISK